MKKFLGMGMLLLVLIGLAGCGRFENPNETYCTEGKVDGVFLCSRPWSVYFDTTVSLTLYVTEEDAYDIPVIFAEVEAILARYHQWFDKYHLYDGVANVMTINQSGTAPTTVDPAFYDAIAFAVAASDDIVLGGVELFNPALGPVLSIWHDARESDLCAETGIGVFSCPIPSAEALAGPFNTDISDLVLDPVLHSVAFAKSGMSLDLGGFGKGYVSEVITDYLDTQNVTYILNSGNSNIKTGGTNPNNDTGLFYVALTTPSLQPALPGSYYVFLQIQGDVSVVTSGTYQRFFRGATDNLVYHHIIDPRTNRPGGEAMAVTIILEDGAKGDVYSTAIFLMTVDEGIAFVDATVGLEAIWYLSDGTIRTSAGLDPFVYEWLD
ncbi:MAG TPA: hypothetical protein DCR44_04175 [Acholeplasmatales bacterium]|nr:hypothetical protein [Acholeplasmatales bacterium]